MWADLADKQPPSEQHACLLQFLGAADRAFSPDLESLIGKQKQITSLEAQRQNFIQTLQEISRELTDAEELSVALTPQSISEVDDRLTREEDQLRTNRDKLLADLKTEAVGIVPAVNNKVEELTDRLVGLQAERELALGTQQRALERKNELDEYRRILSQEIERLERAVEAGNAFADLRVTHCPACDREIQKGSSAADDCYVCKQPLLSAARSGSERIEFEVEQLRGEAGEMDELLSRLATEIEIQQKRIDSLREEIGATEQLLRPVRVAAAAILPPDLAIADMSMGRLQEKRNQLARIKLSLGRREALAEQIKSIQAEIDGLNSTVTEQTSGVDYEGLSDRLSDGMNTYLNKLNKRRKDAWVVGDVAFQLGDRSFKIRVGKADWQTKLGGTLTLYFLLAYQYALMDLARFPECHFPGLLMIDFPAEVEGTTVADKENFVIEPFVELLTQEAMHNCQVIAAGNSFAGLQGVKRVELSHVWKA
jgi:chromosome segregation ATPase